MVFNKVKAPVGTMEMRPGPLRLSLENQTDRRVLPALWIAGDALHDLLGKRRPFLTAKRLLTNQTFRDIYRTDTLDVDQRLKITSLTFLFTDLKGSTALYERVGDLVAYDLVRQHFRVLYEVVAAEAGAVVKTIGDAVMATFPTPDRALAAALRMREEMARINAERGNEDLLLKIGIHEGPCLAVTLNNSQDYFGQTVNMAARVQGLASSHAIFVTKSVVEDMKSAKILRKLRLAADHAARGAARHRRRNHGLRNSLIASVARGLISAGSRSRSRREDLTMSQVEASERAKPAAAARSRQDLSGVVGPVSPRLPRAGLAAERRRPVRGHRLHHPRRAGAGGDRGARARHQADRDGLRLELYRHQPGRIDGAQERRRSRSSTLGGGQGVRVLLVDDLVDTGKTAKVVREIVPRAHLATVYAKPMGRPLVDTFITEVSQDTWIYFPWDTGLAFQPPINEAGL